MKNRLFCQLQGWVSNCRFSPNCLFWPLILTHQPDQHLQGISLSHFLAPFWMQTSLFISHLFINRTFHRQNNYTFKYRNMSLVANHSNNQSRLITEWNKVKEMAAPPSQSQCYPVSGMVTNKLVHALQSSFPDDSGSCLAYFHSTYLLWRWASETYDKC